MKQRKTASSGVRGLVFATASIVLSYPDIDSDATLDVLLDEWTKVTTPELELMRALIEHRRRDALIDLQREYVETFDVRRRCTLHLTYYLNGDTRRRGTALLAFQRVLVDAGYQATNGELPDFLPAVLELGARTNGEAAVELLDSHRAGLRLLAEALGQMASPYEGAVRALELVLPPAKPGVLANARLLALKGPPSEDVGLEFSTVGAGNGYGFDALSMEVRR